MEFDEDLKWICGGIDSYGHVVGHEARFSIKGSSEHTPEEKSATSFLWSVKEQYFMSHRIPQKRDTTEEEHFKIIDWLIKNNYAKEDSFYRKASDD